jgi:hypothetical protein
MKTKILVILTLVLYLSSIQTYARRIRGNFASAPLIPFIPTGIEPRDFWYADMLLFSIISEGLGVPAEEDLIRKWISYPRKHGEQTYWIIGELVKIKEEVEGSELDGRFFILDREGRIREALVKYYREVCDFLGKADEKEWGEALVVEILSEFFRLSFKADTNCILSDLYDRLFCK